MDKQAALQKISDLEAELAKLKQIVSQEDTKEQRIEAAKKWLTDWLNENREKFTCRLGDNRIFYFLGDQWAFDLDLENKLFWCYYHMLWKKIEADFDLEYLETQGLVKDVLLNPFNCEGFTPSWGLLSHSLILLKPFNCEGFTPAFRCFCA